jgi:hypothetical protein
MKPRSWSPDGRWLAGSISFYATPTSVTLLYSFEEKAYRVVPAGRGIPAWMNDSRRLVVAQYDRIVMLDSRTGSAHALATASPQPRACRSTVSG